MNKKHGYSGTPTYIAWNNMIKRCSSTRKSYGGRGITVCKRWLKIENFIADMGEKPEGKTLDRKDNDGNYTPRNCRWATPKEQMLNNSRTIFLLVDGVEMSCSDAAKKWGISEGAVRQRIYRQRRKEYNYGLEKLPYRTAHSVCGART